MDDVSNADFLLLEQFAGYLLAVLVVAMVIGVIVIERDKKSKR